MSEPYDVTTARDRAEGFRRYVDRTGREWTEPRPGFKPAPAELGSPSTPAGFREVTLRAWTDGDTVIVPEQEGFWLPEETPYEGPGSHDCDANGCGWEHVLARFRLPKPVDDGTSN
jgi:hypothetical protein